MVKYRDNKALYMQEYRRKHPQKNKDACRKYYHNNRAKEIARKKLDFQKFKKAGYSDKHRMYQRLNCRYRHLATKCENPLTETEWFEILESADFKCTNCGSSEDLTMDHIIPISKGGQHTRTNIGVLCRSCNSSKGSKII